MIQMNDFSREPADLRERMLAAAARVLESGWYVLGDEVSAFETEWARACGSTHCVGVGNGLDAIEIGLRALGIGAGDEVVTTPMTAFATTLAVLRAGATPVFADIDAETAMLDTASVRRCLTPRTRAVLLVHLYGQGGPVRELAELTTEHELHLIEDCAQAHGVMIDGRPAGSFGAFGAWSFYPTKNLGAIGDAGAITTGSPALAEAARTLRNYGQTERYHHPVPGLNSRLDELQAALLRARLPYLPEWTRRRSEIARSYAGRIRNPRVQVLPVPDDAARHVHHLFVVLCADRDALAAHLRRNGVEALVHYPVPVHLQPPCRDFGRDPQGLAAAEAHAARCLSVPCHAGLRDDEIDRIVEAVNAY